MQVTLSDDSTQRASDKRCCDRANVLPAWRPEQNQMRLCSRGSFTPPAPETGFTTPLPEPALLRAPASPDQGSTHPAGNATSCCCRLRKPSCACPRWRRGYDELFSCQSVSGKLEHSWTRGRWREIRISCDFAQILLCCLWN